MGYVRVDRLGCDPEVVNSRTSAGALWGIILRDGPRLSVEKEIDEEGKGANANAFWRHATAALEITTFSTLLVDAWSSESTVVCVCSVRVVRSVGA